MSDILFFNFIAIALIVLIIWWFWIAKSKSTKINKNEITVYVKDGVYSPNRIETPQNEVVINFIRKDVSSCSEYVVFSELDINVQLPLNKPKKVYLKNLAPGHYSFACQMGMYKGELIIIAK